MKILTEISPSERERKKIEKISNSFLKKLNSKLIDAQAIIAGSIAKNTWLSGNTDIDIFVKFNYEKYRNKDISKELEKNLKKHKLIHGSRDYFRIMKKGYNFELIPVLDIKDSSKAINITDVSPLHAEWVKKNLHNSNEVRLAKKFCRANNIYGAESYIKGFSGYVLEILICYYKSFFELVKNVANWNKQVIIDIEKYYKNEKEVLKKINKSKHSPLILVDPVDKTRNAAAALSKEKFEEFINTCREYLRNPSDEFFIEKKFNLKEILDNSAYNKVVVFKVKPLKGKKDVVGNKILKVLNHINKRISEYGFRINQSDWRWNKNAYLWYYIRDEELPILQKHYGPPIKEAKHVEEFRKKWEKYSIHEEDNRIYIELKRKYRTIKPFVKTLLKDPYIKENIKRIKVKVY